MSQYVRHIWVSYSGAQKDWVHGLTKAFYDDNSARIKLLTYLKDANAEDAGKPFVSDGNQALTDELDYIPFLKNGHSIEDLIRSIGANLRRIVVISPNYLNSIFCMQELACILTHANYKPIQLFSIGQSFREIRNNFSYRLRDQDRKPLLTGDASLEHALAVVYFYRIETIKANTKEFEIPKEELKSNDFEGVKSYFENKLAILQNHNECVTVSGNFGEDSAKSVTPKQTVIEYVNTFQPQIKQEIKEQEVKVDNAIRGWFDDAPLAKELSKQYDADYLIEGLGPKDNTSISQFCIELKNHSMQEFYKVDRDRIISLMLQKVLDPECIVEMKNALFFTDIIRISTYDKNEEGVLQFAAISAAGEFVFRFNNLASETNSLSIKNEIKLKPTTPDENAEVENHIYEQVVAKAFYETQGDTLKEKLKSKEPYEIRGEVFHYLANFKLSQSSPYGMFISACFNENVKKTDQINRVYEVCMSKINSDIDKNDPSDVPVQIPLIIKSYKDVFSIPPRYKSASHRTIGAIKKLLAKSHEHH